MGVPLAVRNLLEGRARFVMSVGGVALAMLLILILDGIFAGSMRQVTAYIERTPFDVAVAQKGVRNLHMTVSFFPRAKLREIERVPGVAKVEPILYLTDFLVSGDKRSVAYVFGVEDGGKGGPWAMQEGPSMPGSGEIIIDARVAESLRLGLGDEITVLGRDWRIGGLAKGTVNIVNSIAWVRAEDFEAARRTRGVVSYALVTAKPDADPEAVARRIERTVDDVSAQTRPAFSAGERRLIGDMSVDIMRVMNLFGFLIGLAVVGLTVYTATLSKLRDYGVLKALGANDLRLFGVVLGQAAMSIAAGITVAAGLALALAYALEALGSNVQVFIEWASIAKVVGGAAVIGALGSAVPILRIAGVDPAQVFRR